MRILTAKSEAIVKAVDHVAIQTNNIQYMFSLFSEKFQLPIVWPMARYGINSIGVVSAGNVNIEIMQYVPAKVANPLVPKSAHLYALAFEPVSLVESLRELNRRMISCSPPIPLWGKRYDGYQGKLWTNILIAGILEGSAANLTHLEILKRSLWINVLVGLLVGRLTSSSWAKPFITKSLGRRAILITEYTHDTSAERNLMLKALRNRQGGPLGIEAVREIRIGVSRFEENLERWQNLLSPISTTSPGCWQPEKGPAVRLVQDSEDTFLGFIFQVSSLERAAFFLSENDLLEGEAMGQLKLDPTKIGGLDIRLVERSTG